MRVATIYLTLFIVALCTIDSATAQLLPERQLVRSGNEAFKNKEFDKSLELYNEALEVAPECYEATYNRANAYYHTMLGADIQDTTKSWEQSNSYYEDMANNTRYSKEQRAEALRNIGESLMTQQSHEAALNAFRESLLLNPNDQETKYNYVLAKRIVDQKREQQQQQGGGDNNQNNDQNQDEQQQQQEQQQSGGGNNDQNQDQNQDQNDDQKGNQKGDQNKDGDNQQNNDDSGEDKQESGNGDGQERSDDNQQQEQPQGGSGNEDSDTEQPDGQANTPQPTGLSQEQERLLDAIQSEEDKTQDKLKDKKKALIIPGKKNW
jgi:hypothetical protein